MPSHGISQIEVSTVRESGRMMADRGFFEIDLSSGYVTWANEFALEKLGYTLDQIQSFNQFTLIPDEFHEELRNVTVDQLRGRFHRFSIWPYRTATNKIVWWYTAKFKHEHPLYWNRCEYLDTTDSSGPEYVSMCAIMNATNGYNEMFFRFDDFQTWTRREFSRVDQELSNVRKDNASLHEEVKLATHAAKTAADIGLQNQKAIADLTNGIADQLANQTTEILRLMRTDVSHDERIKSFEDHMKRTTDDAVKQISTQANKANVAITNAGKGLSRKVTIPVGSIAAVATIIQWLIQFFHGFH